MPVSEMNRKCKDDVKKQDLLLCVNSREPREMRSNDIIIPHWRSHAECSRSRYKVDRVWANVIEQWRVLTSNVLQKSAVVNTILLPVAEDIKADDSNIRSSTNAAPRSHLPP